MIPKKEISLLPEEENPNSLASRVIHWLTTVGRVIIVITEFIVIIAFISRFWLDRKNADLSEVIRQQRAILESTRDFENTFLDTQKKLSLIKSYYDNAPNYSEKIKSLVESTPPDIIFKTVNVTKDQKSNAITSSATLYAYSEDSIVNFMTNLTLNPAIQTVDIASIEKKPKENKYTINVNIVFKSSKKA